VKFPGEASERVARALLTHGPQTVADLADLLGLTPSGVRRHLAALADLGYVSAQERAPYGPAPKRGRGRPGSVFTLTDQGRSACGSSYDDLALSALRYLDAEFGADAVAGFAAHRARSLAAEVAGVNGCTPEELAEVLTTAGYAAEVQPLGDIAVQLCQHSCPVVDAAREFPILCEAETAELARVLDRHVTRLATLAHGDEVCTAVIPVRPTGDVPVGSGEHVTRRSVPTIARTAPRSPSRSSSRKAMA
jgi:predicted ArsR family transcriptional regulator